MTNSDVLRRIRYILDLNDSKMISTFKQADSDVSRQQVSNWLKQDEDPEYTLIRDADLAKFLTGLIIEKRGKRDGEVPVSEKKLTNNIVFRKLVIAFNLKSEEVLEILGKADLRVGKSELSAFFRKPTHKNYRDCKDQILRNFLIGLQTKLAEENVSS
ncbi:MAG: hypothetical protein ACJAS4_001206 [Bacteriovoracaceae bacterium]|jgi:uncharacterized protein YehS (DUF1456 family)